MSEDRELTMDQVAAQMELDELGDARLLPPREFAKLVGVAPQLVYYYIRTGKIEVVVCDCGRKCVEVAPAREFMGNRKSQVDTRADGER
jgi:hypothetical protein